MADQADSKVHEGEKEDTKAGTEGGQIGTSRGRNEPDRGYE